MNKRLYSIFALALPLLAMVSCNFSEEYHEGGDTGNQQSQFEVVEFTPAPGQFINEGYTATSAVEACEYAQSRLDNRLYISLGGFGGYIIAKCKTPITISDGYDFGIYSNTFDGSSEPGIVWVSCDTNANGVADDEWFELYGSESEKENTRYRYEITYSRTDDATKIAWHDNLGESGIISRNSTHTQDYFPAWITTEEYTLSGTCLPHNSEWDEASKEWILRSLEWGYVDNFSAIDLAADRANRFRISDAHTASGDVANLAQIDFIKVQSAINRINSAIGETSTEVSGFVSYNK
jgi:hypothetical protein